MYLDDGVSRNSAPMSCFKREDSGYSGKTALVADTEAKGCYRHVCVTNVWLVYKSNFHLSV